jgi:hypothetical protein
VYVVPTEPLHRVSPSSHEILIAVDETSVITEEYVVVYAQFSLHE